MNYNEQPARYGASIVIGGQAAALNQPPPAPSALDEVLDAVNSTFQILVTAEMNIGGFLDRFHGNRPQPTADGDTAMSPCGQIGAIHQALASLREKAGIVSNMSAQLSQIA